MKRYLLIGLILLTLQTYPIPGHHLPDGGLWEDEAGVDCHTTACWSEADQQKVAFICYDEMQGLLEVGMASCAATIANRERQPKLWGKSLDWIIRYNQFAVISAKTRPWEQGKTPPPEALAAVARFVSGEHDPRGCWQYDSFQGSTPEIAKEWLKVAPERRCIIVRAPQAALFFNWRDG